MKISFQEVNLASQRYVITSLNYFVFYVTFKYTFCFISATYINYQEL